jgi:hypothetical protein
MLELRYVIVVQFIVCASFFPFLSVTVSVQLWETAPEIVCVFQNCYFLNSDSMESDLGSTDQRQS